MNAGKRRKAWKRLARMKYLNRLHRLERAAFSRGWIEVAAVFWLAREFILESQRVNR